MSTASAPTDLARRIDEELVEFIEAEGTMLEPEARPLLDELESLILSGGKRLRPRFCYWGFRAAGGVDNDDIIRIGAALELLHTMALIHDDVMDRASVRRNRASAFRVFGRALGELSAGTEHRGDPQRFGASAAILCGMLGFVLADRLFRLARRSLVGSAAAAERYDRLRTRAIAGQYLDVLTAHRGSADEATTRRVASLKSGSYSVGDPLAIGALLAGGSDAIVSSLEAFGHPLGEAFQIRDDILGTFGDPATTGKDTEGDIREGKQTLLLARARERANDAQLKVLDRHVGNPELRPTDAESVREVIVATGALETANDLVRELCDAATSALEEAAIDDDVRAELLRLADEATSRRS